MYAPHLTYCNKKNSRSQKKQELVVILLLAPLLIAIVAREVVQEKKNKALNSVSRREEKKGRQLMQTNHIRSEIVTMLWSSPWRWLLPFTTAAVLIVVVFIAATFKLLIILWWKPRRIEQHFSKQGIRGPPYRFFVGNLREMVGLMLEASSTPMSPQSSHNILPRVLSFYNHWRKIYGSTFLLWFGPTARLAVANPDLIREIFVSRAEFFERYESHPLVRKLEGDGLVSLRGEKWAHHRKILTPTFHMDNLKLLIPTIGKTVIEMMDKWTAISLDTARGEVEIDVEDWFQRVTEDAITRTAFGRSYDDGKAVFRLQAQQMIVAAEAFRMILVPGYR